MTGAKRLSVIATFTMIPLDLLLAYGFTFTSPKNISAWHWAFVWFTFYLNIIAILVSWEYRRFAAFWVLGNTAVSLAIALGFLRETYVEGIAEGHNLFTALSLAALQAMVMATFLWVPPLVFAGRMLWLTRASTSHSTNNESSGNLETGNPGGKKS